MAKYEKFEDLPVRQEARRLYSVVLDLLEEPHVPLTPGFRNQLDRAALSVLPATRRFTRLEENAFVPLVPLRGC